MSGRCDVHTNWSVGKDGRCGRRDFCLDKGSLKCGEIIHAKGLLGKLKRAHAEQLELEKELIT